MVQNVSTLRSATQPKRETATHSQFPAMADQDTESHPQPLAVREKVEPAGEEGRREGVREDMEAEVQEEGAINDQKEVEKVEEKEEKEKAGVGMEEDSSIFTSDVVRKFQQQLEEIKVAPR